SRAGYIQLSPPRRYSMFFAPRTSGPYQPSLRSGAGVGVSFPDPDPSGNCHVVLEALSPDVGCPQYQEPTVPTACEMSYARGDHTDAAVDELARRVRETLGPRASVN